MADAGAVRKHTCGAIRCPELQLSARVMESALSQVRSLPRGLSC